MITQLLSIPLIGIFALLITPQTILHPSHRNYFSQFISVFTAFTAFTFSLNFLKEINKIPLAYGQDLEVQNWFMYYVSPLAFTMDGLSFIFVLLTTSVILLVAISLAFNKKLYSHPYYKFYFIAVLTIEFLLLGAFTTADILFFYIFFEAILIPMYFIIGIWGSGFRKIKAGYYFFLYTLVGSLFMLLAIIVLVMETGSTSLNAYLLHPISFELQKILWVLFFLSFSVKIPLFPFHIWLPEAHVEAPTEGSVILAALLLKLGGYGFIRYSLQLLPEASFYYAPFIYTLAILGIIYSSLTALRQTDMKRIIAYSSVAHMNFAVLGIFSMNPEALVGSVFLMFGHGIVSSALFFLVGILYRDYGSRLISYYGGLAHVIPVFSATFLFFSFANVGLPGTVNFVGELLVFCGVGTWSFSTVVFCGVGFILSVVYSIWLYNRVCFGTLRTLFIKSFSNDLNTGDYLVLLPLVISTLLFGLLPNLVIDLFGPSLADITHRQNALVNRPWFF